MDFSHKPVMLYEAIQALNIKENGIYVDGTAGGGGHSAEILKRLTTGKLISIDQDPDAVMTVRKRFEGNPNSIVIKGNFGDIKELLSERGIGMVDGILLDIGVSSHQLDTAQRGFSYHEDAFLDMRMSKSGTTAAELINSLSCKELASIISRYGEEKYAMSIAREIVRVRQENPIETTLQLAEVVKNAVPQKVRRESHPAKKTFQALRIAVNGELDRLVQGLEGGFEMLSHNGRFAVITFHSLEDRIVKQTMAKWCEGCTCPKDFPVCVCHNTPKAKLIGKKPLTASEEELENNRRSRSAKLRVCEKI